MTIDFASIPGCEFYPQRDLTPFTTFRLRSVGDLIEVHTIEALQRILPLIQDRGYLVVGWGANQILPAVCEKYVLHLAFQDSELSDLSGEYELPASIGLNKLTALAIKHGLKGWEVFTGIPASLGGAIYMNAGTNLGEIGSLVKSVTLITPAGTLRTQMIGPGSFSYRHNHFVGPGEVIVGATLIHRGVDPTISQKIRDYLEYRKQTQPLATRNCGCVFKNPLKEMPAGKLIDLLQLKGVGLEALKVSSKHGNFMENMGAADWDQFKALVELITFEANVFYGIEFELEVKIPYH